MKLRAIDLSGCDMLYECQRKDALGRSSMKTQEDVDREVDPGKGGSMAWKRIYVGWE
jgi:hypothetical protein